MGPAPWLRLRPVCGVARRGVARRGVAWRGVARRGAAWRGVAWRGVARRRPGDSADAGGAPLGESGASSLAQHTRKKNIDKNHCIRRFKKSSLYSEFAQGVRNRRSQKPEIVKFKIVL